MTKTVDAAETTTVNLNYKQWLQEFRELGTCSYKGMIHVTLRNSLQCEVLSGPQVFGLPCAAMPGRSTSCKSVSQQGHLRHTCCMVPSLYMSCT